MSAIGLDCDCYVVLMVPWVGLECVILGLSDHTHLPFEKKLQGQQPPTKSRPTKITI